MVRIRQEPIQLSAPEASVKAVEFILWSVRSMFILLIILTRVSSATILSYVRFILIFSIFPCIISFSLLALALVEI